MASGISVGALYASLALDKSKFEADVKSSKGLFGSLADVAKTSALVIGAALLAVGAAAVKMVTDYDAGVDAIRAGTGATGKALDGLVDTFGRAAKRVPDDLATVGTVIAELNTRTGATGDTLEDLAVNLLDFSRITKTDVNDNVRASTRLFGDWSIATQDQAETLDEVFRASQRPGSASIGSSELVVDFGAPMRLLGFSFEESDRAPGQVGEGGRQHRDDALGPQVRGEDARRARASRPPTWARPCAARSRRSASRRDPVGASIKTFGLRAGPDLAAAILEGRFATDDLVASIVNGTDTIAAATADTKDLGELWSQIFNTATVAVGEKLLPVLDGLLVWITANLPAIEATVDAAFGAIGDGHRLARRQRHPAAGGGVRRLHQRDRPGLRGGDRLADRQHPAAPPEHLRDLGRERPARAAARLRLRPGLDLRQLAAHLQGHRPGRGLREERDGRRRGGVQGRHAGHHEGRRRRVPGGRRGRERPAHRDVDRVRRDRRGLADRPGTSATAVTKGIGDAFEGLKRGIKVVWDGITGIIKGAINTVIDAVNGMIRALNGIQIHIPTDRRRRRRGRARSTGTGSTSARSRASRPAPATSAAAGRCSASAGPELARLPRGTDVFTAAQSRDLLAGGSGRAGPLIGSQTIYGVQPGDVERETRRALRRAALAWSLGGT